MGGRASGASKNSNLVGQRWLARVVNEYIQTLSDDHFDELKEAVKGDEYDPEVKTIATLKIWEYIMGKDEDWVEEVRGE